jgi:hypothetical protein
MSTQARQRNTLSLLKLTALCAYVLARWFNEPKSTVLR